MFSLRNSVKLIPKLRTFSTNGEIAPIFTNRNPRNLERLRIGYKPDGYHVEAPGKSFWHKLQLKKTGRYVYAHVEHFENGIVVQANTNEWAIKKQLHRFNDTAAFINLGRVLADRCLQSGLTEIRSDKTSKREDGKIALFLKALEDGGIKLTEPPQYKNPNPWDQNRPEKPWNVLE